MATFQINNQYFDEFFFVCSAAISWPLSSLFSGERVQVLFPTQIERFFFLLLHRPSSQLELVLRSRSCAQNRKMKRLTTCCCCRVRTGATIIAVLCLIGSGISFMGESVGLITKDNTIAQLEQMKALAQHEKDEGTISEEQYVYIVTYANTIIAVLPYVLGIGFTFAAINLAVAVSLMIGLLKKKHVMMLPWLIIYMISFVVQCMVVVGLAILFFFVLESVGGGFIFLLICTPLLFLSFYFWWVVQSEYCNIKEGRQSHVH